MMDFKITPASMRPLKPVLVRREVDKDGRPCVILSAWVGGYLYEEEVVFDNETAAHAYIGDVNKAQARKFMERAEAEAAKNKPDEQKQS